MERTAVVRGLFLGAVVRRGCLGIRPKPARYPAGSNCIFGQEHWVQAKSNGESDNKSKDGARWVVRKNIHNAFAAFPKGCPVLPFLVDLVLRMMKRVDPDYIAPQMMGPKLLSSLHSLAAFDYVADVGALSPDVLREIATRCVMHNPNRCSLQIYVPA